MSECTVWVKHLLDKNEFKKWSLHLSTSAASLDKQAKGEQDAARNGNSKPKGGNVTACSSGKTNGDISEIGLPFH